MAEIIRLRGSPHEEVQRLLPWLVNGTLGPDESELVSQHLAECAECRGDIDAERKLSLAFKSLPADVEASWTGMEQRLEAERPVVERAERGLWRRRVPLGWAVASPVAAAAAVALVMLSVTPRAPADQQYRALGAANTTQAANIVVLFDSDTQEKDLRAALAAASARVVDGPTATGAYLLRVDGTQREQALKSLRDNDSIALAEPIDGAGGR